MSCLITNSIYEMPAVGTCRPSWKRVRLGDPGIEWPEAWLRDHVHAQPELVLGPCRAFGFIDKDEAWRVWKSELTVEGVGGVDVALVSSDGRVALVEVKLASNPENRRKVVAQLLDYAVHLREASIEDLPELPTEGGVPFVDADDVQRHLQAGDFLLVVAADEADPRAAKLTRAVLDRNAIHPWDLALIDIALFAPAERPLVGLELLCVPHVVGGVRCESRHVVEVKVTTSTENPSVVVKLAEPEETGSVMRAWTRDSFKSAFPSAASSSALATLVMAWIEGAGKAPETEVRYGKGKHPTVNFCSSDVIFASAERNGIWVQGREVLNRAFGEVAGGQRWNQIRALFPEQADTKPYFQVRSKDPRLSEAVAIVRKWNSQ